MKDQSRKQSIEELKNQIALKEKEHQQALKANIKFEDLAKIFSEKTKLEEELKTMELLTGQDQRAA